MEEETGRDRQLRISSWAQLVQVDRFFKISFTAELFQYLLESKFSPCNRTITYTSVLAWLLYQHVSAQHRSDQTVTCDFQIAFLNSRCHPPI